MHAELYIYGESLAMVWSRVRIKSPHVLQRNEAKMWNKLDFCEIVDEECTHAFTAYHFQQIGNSVSARKFLLVSC